MVVVEVVVVVACALMLSRFGCVAVTGASMRPALAPRDLVLFARAPQRVEPGDMVLLGGVGHAFVHRIAAMRGDGLLVTRGDANPIPDFEPTATSSVKGVVRAVLPLGKLLERLAALRGSARLGSQSHTGSDDGDGVREGAASDREGLSTARARPAARTVHSISCELNARSSRQ